MATFVVVVSFGFGARVPLDSSYGSLGVCVVVFHYDMMGWHEGTGELTMQQWTAKRAPKQTRFKAELGGHLHVRESQDPQSAHGQRTQQPNFVSTSCPCGHSKAKINRDKA